MPILFTILCAAAFALFAYRMNRRFVRGENSQLNWLIMVGWALSAVIFLALAIYSWVELNMLTGFGQ